MNRLSPLLSAVLTLLAALLPLAACGGGGGSGPGGTTVVDGTPPGGGPVNPPVLPSPDAVRPTAGALRTGRYAHSATLLASGAVLVAGGTLAGTTIGGDAELFSPATGTFTPVAAPLRSPRSNHTATRLLDGRVLLAGGWFNPSPGVLQAQDRAEIFDPGTGAFTEVGRLRQARVDHAAALLPDGRVLITGGSVLNGAFLADLSSAEVFDPATGAFTLHPTGMLHSHATHACLQVGPTQFVIAGGSDSDLRAELFDSGSSAFSPLNLAAGDAPRFNAAAATFATGGMVMAGGDGAGTVMMVRPPGALLQSTGSPLTRPRHYASASRIATDQILVVGGVDFEAGGALLASADLIVEGGLSGALTYATELRFPVPLAAHSATVLADGRVLLCGGLVGDDAQSGRADAFLFTP